jgi:hypothetical protein
LVANIANEVDQGNFDVTGWANFDVYEQCAYYSTSDDAVNGAAVIDVSDSANPVMTELLTTPGIGAAWESLRANVKRGLLVAGNDAEPWLDVYDVSQDCAHPILLSSTAMPTAVGHEGWLSPDGTTYYQADAGDNVTAVDLRNPAEPRELAKVGSSHGGSTSLDGTRAFNCRTSGNALDIWDTTGVAAGIPQGQGSDPVLISSTPLDGGGCQQTYPLFYDGVPYILQMGELGGNLGFCTGTDEVTQSPPQFIDISDETAPRIHAVLVNEVSDPANCHLVQHDRNIAPFSPGDLQPGETNLWEGVTNSWFTYGTHECTPDRTFDPTIIACAEFFSGIRVYDVRDPLEAKEIAYFNWGALSPGLPTIDMAAARPVIRIDTGEIWFASMFKGFTVVKFADGVYPFPETLQCPEQYDHLLDQYSDMCPASMYGETTAAEPSGAAPGQPPADDTQGDNSASPTPVTGGGLAVAALLALAGGWLALSRKRQPRERG